MLQPAKDSIDVGIFVKDISTMLDFYQGTLGLEKTEEVPTAFGTIHRFRHGTSDIKLMDPKEVPPAAPNGFGKRLGIGYLTFVIKDLSGLCAALKDKGGGVHHPGNRNPPRHPDRHDQGPRGQYSGVCRARLKYRQQAADRGPQPVPRAPSSSYRSRLQDVLMENGRPSSAHSRRVARRQAYPSKRVCQ